MAIITLPEGRRHKAGMRRGEKDWVKTLTGVDRTKTDGYAFQGNFLTLGATVEYPEGTWFLHHTESRGYSGKILSRTVALLRIEDGALTGVAQWPLDGSAGWALRVRDAIADLITPKPATTPDDFHYQRTQLGRVVEAGPGGESDTFQLKVKGAEETNWLRVTPDQLQALISVLFPAP